MPPPQQDARALLRAAQQATGSSGTTTLNDAFASYHPRTQALRCSACSYAAIKHDSLWPAHAASKSHKLNVAKLKAAQEAEQQQRVGEKRKAATAHEEADKRVKTSSPPPAAVDAEWALFEAEVLNAPNTSADAIAPKYVGSTVEVAPVLRAESGQPPHQQRQDDDEAPVQVAETAEQKRARLEQEEKEEIYARLEDEQRTQDEAEER